MPCFVRKTEYFIKVERWRLLVGGQRSVAAKQPKYFLKMNCICCHVEEEVEEDPVDKITNAFNVMDINGDGFVTFNEFKKVKKK